MERFTIAVGDKVPKARLLVSVFSPIIGRGADSIVIEASIDLKLEQGVGEYQNQVYIIANKDKAINPITTTKKYCL